MIMKRNKYFNVKTNGYDSKKEAARAAKLKLLQQAAAIHSLKEQVPFVLLKAFKDKEGETEKGIKYYADFVYYDMQKKTLVIEDVKSPITKKKPEYIIKRKLVKHLNPEYLFIET